MSEKLTLNDNRDFRRLYNRGKSFVSPVLVTYIMKNKSDNLRYGITTGKKIGNAVRRSRARRVIRAAFRELTPHLNNGYDIVFVGSPIWYGTYAAPLMTFFDSNKLSGKTVVPFCTHGGGGAGRFFDDVKKSCPEAKVLEGLVIRGSNQIERRLDIGVTSHHTEDDVVEWLNRIFK
jgi:ribonuclease P protein component